MRIREAGSGEGPTIAREFWYPLAERMERYSKLNELSDDALETAEEGFEKLLEKDEQFIFLLEVDGTDVAYISGELGERPTRKLDRYVSIDDLYVKEEFRERGYGTRLLEEAKALAEAEDCQFLRVAAEWDNEAARRFYEKHGYEPKQVKYAKSLD